MLLDEIARLSPRLERKHHRGCRRPLAAGCEAPIALDVRGYLATVLARCPRDPPWTPYPSRTGGDGWQRRIPPRPPDGVLLRYALAGWAAGRFARQPPGRV